MALFFELLKLFIFFRIFSYEEVNKFHPEWQLSKIPSKALTIKTLLI